MAQQVEVVRKVLSRGYNISPEALAFLLERNLEELDSLLDSVPDKAVIELEDLKEALKRIEKRAERRLYETGEDVGGIRIIKSPTNLGVKGSSEEFIELMRRRFQFLKSLLVKKSGVDPIPISNLLNSTSRNGDRVLVVGMILEKRVLRDFSIRMVIDDESGSIPVIFKKGSRYWDKADKIPVDSVVAIKGTFINGRLYADSFRIPDLNGELVEPGSASGKVALISDIHMGSRYFNEQAFERFVRWLNSEYARDVKFLVICGDLVDGIGVYPNQEEELKIVDVYKQFQLASSFLERIPRDVKVIYIPGNHEPVRQAEPQPVVPEEYLDHLLEVRPDLIALPNPAMIGIGDVRILLYHGRSLNAVFKHIPGLQPIRPETVVEAMRWILRLRHLAPIYGEHPIAPESEDWLLIDQVPHVLHVGHIHVYGVGEYNGVKIVNSGTFENETPYIKSLGIEVTVGKAPILDLKSREVEVKDFSS